jgi:hypothetical protein
VQQRRAEWTRWPERHLVLDMTRPIEENLDAALRYVAGTPG